MPDPLPSAGANQTPSASQPAATGQPPAAAAPAAPAAVAAATTQQQPTEGQGTTAQQPAEGTKTEGEQAQKPQGAPDKYEFKAPEGVKLDDAVIADFSTIAKELNLPQDAAQKVVDKLAPKIAERQAAAQAEAFKAINTQWTEATKADKELGGDKLDANLAIAKKALDAFGSPELRKLLNDTGIGNNPEVIRAFYRAGKAISEDSLVPGSTKPAAPQKDAATALYGNKTA